MDRALKRKKAAVIATGWVGDTIACTAAATSLYELGYEVTFFTRWPQLKEILSNDGRFTVKVYWHLKIIKVLRIFINSYFDKAVWEPSKWSYAEPFTSEIRRIAGCKITPEYQLFLGNSLQLPRNPSDSFPVIAIGRDIYKRSFGRNVDELVTMLSMFANVVWVGLAAHKNSKHGKVHSLLNDVKKIAAADLFFGPEGGLLWLAAGIGKPCAYLTENISKVAKENKLDSLNHVLGSKNYFPNSKSHLALPDGCTNQEVVQSIKSMLDSLKIKESA